MYLFAGIMIVLNIAAFGPGFAFNRRRVVGDSTRDKGDRKIHNSFG